MKDNITSYKDVSFLLNPTNTPPTPINLNQKVNLLGSNSINDFRWDWKLVSYIEKNNDYPKLSTDLMNISNNSVKPFSINSKNGNLEILQVDPYYIHKFSASIYRNQGYNVKLNLGWESSITIYVNNNKIFGNDYGQPNNNTPLNLFLNSGWNDLDILIYTTSGVNFTLNTDLGLYADDWDVPSFNPPSGVNIVGVTNFQTSSSKKDPNLAIVSWDLLDRDNVLGYTIERMGPYDTGVYVSGFINSGCYPTYISGVTGLKDINGFLPRCFYYISPVKSGIEGVISSGYYIFPTIKNDNLSIISGTSIVTSSGFVQTGIYSYLIAPFFNEKHLITNKGISVFNTGNTIVIDYLATPQYSGYRYDVYRVSGFFPDKITNDNFSGCLITGLYPGSGIYRFYDTIQSLPVVTGINLFTNAEIEGFSSYQYNANRIQWTYASGADSYNVYRTFYENYFDGRSYIGNTTGTNILDPGGVLDGYPTSYISIGDSPNYRSQFFDNGVIGNKYYKYRVRAYNYGFIEGNPSNEVIFIAGDQIAPNTPSGISITSLNGFATIGWQNGIEPDLEGTIIYQSSDGSTYNEIGRTPGNTFSTFIGYSGVPRFKLANYDTSDNVSPLSSAYQGSGVMRADNVILSDFTTLSTVDMDMDYYLFSGVSLPTTSPYRSKILPIIHPGSAYTSSFLAVCLDRASANQVRAFSVDDSSNLSEFTFDTAVPTRLSGFYGVAVSSSPTDPITSNKLMIAFYSGVNSNAQGSGFFLHYRVWSKSLGQYNQLTTSSGFCIGNYLEGKYYPNDALFAQPSPVIASYSGNVNNNIIIFLSGNQSDQLSFGFMGLNYNGVQSGITKFMNIHQSNMVSTSDFSACYDNDGYIHLVWQGNIGIDNSPILWYKVNPNINNTSPVTILASGKYTRGVGPYGGYLLDSTFPFKMQLNHPRIFCDQSNKINMLFKEYGDYSRLISYSQMDTSGVFSITPNILYQIPFPFDINSWDVAYGRNSDILYTNYNMVQDIYPYQKKIPYNFTVGSYRRRHEFERYSNASLYQIIQSVLK